jgi:MoxR-like ATPase
MPDSLPRRYVGDGQAHYSPLAVPAELAGDPVNPEQYVAPADLAEAVNMALTLRRPLLLEGEPGTGKTRLAYAVAYELGYPLYANYIRSTSRARDLLYTFDALQRLYDLQEPPDRGDGAEVLDKRQYVRPGKLGQAIQLAADHDLPSVVLIDEIDKADIDFPNDLLLELDRLQFTVDEVTDPPALAYDALRGQRREERRDVLPLILVTSNREKELPGPFLRRCLFYYIPFPDTPEELQQIVKAHFPDQAATGLTPLALTAVACFWSLRRAPITWRKPPSTSELLDWLLLLHADNDTDRLLNQLRDLSGALSYTALGTLPYLAALVKTQSDRDALVNPLPAPTPMLLAPSVPPPTA